MVSDLEEEMIQYLIQKKKFTKTGARLAVKSFLETLIFAGLAVSNPEPKICPTCKRPLE